MELNEKIWLAEAERLTDNTAAWMSGAQSMLTSVEKMLKKEIAERTQAMSKLSNRAAIRAQITTLNKLLQELKSIQP